MNSDSIQLDLIQIDLFQGVLIKFDQMYCHFHNSSYLMKLLDVFFLFMPFWEMHAEETTQRHCTVVWSGVWTRLLAPRAT